MGLAISRGELHLSAASLIAPHLSAETVGEWLKAARHKTIREIKQLIADRSPREAVRSSIRRVSSHSRNADRVLRTDAAPSVLHPVRLPPSGSPQPSPTEARRPEFTACSTSTSTSTATSRASTSSAPAVSSATSASSAPVACERPARPERSGRRGTLSASQQTRRFTHNSRSFVLSFAIRFRMGMSGGFLRGRSVRCSSRSGSRRLGRADRRDRRKNRRGSR